MNRLPPYVHFNGEIKNGKPYYYVIRLGKKIKCCRGFNSPEEAYSAAMVLKRDPKQILNKVTFGQAVDFWLTSLYGTHVRETIQNYRGYFNNWIFPYIDASKNYQKVSDSDLTLWHSIIEENIKLNVKSKNRLRTAFILLYEFANVFLNIDNKAFIRIPSFVGIDLNPFFEVDRKQVLLPEEFSLMFSVSYDTYTRLLLSLFLCCGLRIGEARGLTVDCFSQNKICIAKQVKGDGRGNFILSKTKTLSSRRICYLPVFVSDLLSSHIRINNLKPSDFIFYRRDDHSKPASENLINNRFNKASLKAGVGKIYSHIFRHSVATILGRAGIRQRAIDLLLGHAAKSVTDRHYNLVVEADWQDIISVLDDQIFNEFVIKNVIED